MTLADTSHQVTNLRLTEKGELLADIEILDTPKGKLLSTMTDCGDVVFRLRGIGRLANDNGTYTVSDYQLLGIDAAHRA